jgi:hypothetical protein
MGRENVNVRDYFVGFIHWTLLLKDYVKNDSPFLIKTGHME